MDHPCMRQTSGEDDAKCRDAWVALEHTLSFARYVLAETVARANVGSSKTSTDKVPNAFPLFPKDKYAPISCETRQYANHIHATTHLVV